MAYWGYYDFIKSKLAALEQPTVMEVGVDKGQMFVPLTSYLINNHEDFMIVGVDIKFQDNLHVNLELMKKEVDEENQVILFYENSSLNILPEFASWMESNSYPGMFDVILVDGDHNYYTVTEEFKYIPKLLKPGGVIIFDDYSDRWANKDEYFSELPGYEDNELATKREGTEHPEKKGVKPAIDEFLEANPEWVATDAVHPGHEPVLIYRRSEVELVPSTDPEGVPLTEEQLKERSEKGRKEEQKLDEPLESEKEKKEKE